MLFVAPEFLLLFLPIALAGYWALERWRGGNLAMGWLLLASLVFYGWSGVGTLALFLASLAGNFAMGHWLAKTETRWALGIGVGLNLCLLGIFKYAGFGLENLAALTGWALPHLELRLPLAISFYTFQQIAYLVQCRRARHAEIPWRDYALAVAFFPHLIAGPLVHYRDLVPQFHSQKRRRVARDHFHEAVSLFVIALAKKLLIADSLSPLAATVFEKAQHGPVGVAEAWLGALAYTFQIYFDFSAYSEMALGLGLMFGLRLPVNFRRPYAAVDLRDFWRRWHITLSEFLRDYLYIPLGGNRLGPLRRWLNLFLTMLLGGLWHGAGWTFVAWGGLHGLFLPANHAWAAFTPRHLPRRLSRMSTFTVVVLLWVPFRAPNGSVTMSMWMSMAGVAAAPAIELTSASEPSLLDTVLADIATQRAAFSDGWIWRAALHPALWSWLAVSFAGVMVFACRSNLDLASADRARSPRRAVWLGLILFAIAARSFQAPAGEFLYFRF